MRTYELYEAGDAGDNPTWYRYRTSDDLAELKSAATIIPKWQILDADTGAVVAEGARS